MLGRLRMSVPKCLELYEDMARRVFGKRVKRHFTFKGLVRDKWDASNLEEVIQEIVHRYVPQLPGAEQLEPNGKLDTQNLDEHSKHLNWLDQQFPRLRKMHAPDDLCKRRVAMYSRTILRALEQL